VLIHLIIHQPQALLQVVQRTPYWVWGLLAALLWLGASQWFDRTTSLRRMVGMPLGMSAFSAYGVAAALGHSPGGQGAIGAWLLTAVATTILALQWQPAPPRGSRYDPDTRRFHIPGSVVPLCLIVGIFLTKYAVGIELALQPGLTGDSAFALSVALVYGAFNGLFLARTLRMLRLARGTPRPSH
jgi:hypothetical protein